jgi:translation initiation factor IF-3
VLEDGSSPGVMNTPDAIKLAQGMGLDLVEINPKASPPVVKTIDFGKWKYQQKKQQQEIRKNQKVHEQKEILLRPTTEIGDLTHKANAAKEFLADGHSVKFTVRFRGRELTHPDIGRDKLNWMLEQLNGLIQPSSSISMEGKFMHMVVMPAKQKA